MCAAVGDSRWETGAGTLDCEAVSDREACVEASNGCYEPGGLLVRTGDQVVYRGAAAAAFLAPIESLDEARIVALIAG